MSKELKKFIVTFGSLTAFFALFAIVVVLFVTEHWIAAITLTVPGLAGLIAFMESDGIKLITKLWTEKAG